VSAGAVIAVTLRNKDSLDEPFSWASLASPVCILVIFNLFPIIFAAAMHKNKDHLETPATRAKIGTMYALVDGRYFWSRTYTIVFLLRRTLYVFLTFVMFSYPGIQMQTFIFSSVIYVIYLNHGPVFHEKLTLASEDANEFMFLVICYHMVLFIELLERPEMRENVGLSLIICIFFHLGANTVLIAFVSVKALMRKGKLNKLKAKQAKVLSERHEALAMLKSAQLVNNIFNKKRHRRVWNQHRAVFEQEMRYVETKAAIELKEILPLSRKEAELALWKARKAS
jgi:hypothetical protein